jgi:aminoglycoside phosphotransferase (APT) family kinase protein
VSLGTPTAAAGPSDSGIPGVDFARLTQWMDDLRLGEGVIERITPISGGTQNIMVRFARSSREYVLRRPPLHLRGNSNQTMRREARLLGALASTHVPHPRLVAACHSEDVLGALFYLMEPVDGFNARNGLPTLHARSSEMRRRMGFALVDAIAALGALDIKALGLSDFGKPEAYLERQVSRWQSQLAGYSQLADWPGPQELAGLDILTDWLVSNRPSHFRPGVMHGDYHIANVIFHPADAEVAAIVDWELATIGDPLIDLGWLLATSWAEEIPGSGKLVPVWSAFPSPAELRDRYAAASVRDLSAMNWYVVFACFKLAILLEGTYARACAGKADRSIGEQLHAKARELLRRGRLWLGGGYLPICNKEGFGGI